MAVVGFTLDMISSFGGRFDCLLASFSVNLAIIANFTFITGLLVDTVDSTTN